MRSSLSHAWAINNLGNVAGESHQPGSDAFSVLPHAFFWRSGMMTGLGSLGGSTSSARGLNDADEVVGGASDRQGGTVAFLWKNGKMFDLNVLAGIGTSQRAITAMGINNSGHIVGMGSVAISKRSAELQAYLLIPKP